MAERQANAEECHVDVIQEGKQTLNGDTTESSWRRGWGRYVVLASRWHHGGAMCWCSFAVPGVTCR